MAHRPPTRRPIDTASAVTDDLVCRQDAEVRWFDHIMHAGRYSQEGGNHFAAGVTYFSVLSVFPL